MSIVLEADMCPVAILAGQRMPGHIVIVVEV